MRKNISNGVNILSLCKTIILSLLIIVIISLILYIFDAHYIDSRDKYISNLLLSISIIIIIVIQYLLLLNLVLNYRINKNIKAINKITILLVIINMIWTFSFYTATYSYVLSQNMEKYYVNTSLIIFRIYSIFNTILCISSVGFLTFILYKENKIFSKAYLLFFLIILFSFVLSIPLYFLIFNEYNYCGNIYLNPVTYLLETHVIENTILLVFMILIYSFILSSITIEFSKGNIIRHFSIINVIKNEENKLKK